MPQLWTHRFAPIFGLVALCAGTAAARAQVITNSPSLPVLNSPYIAAASLGCFPAAMACVSGGSLTLTSVVSSTFDSSGQDITADATYMGELTDLSNAPIGPLDLSGTISEEIVGRGSDTDTGTWTTDLTALSLTGQALGHTLDLTLGGASSGTTSVIPLGENKFQVTSFLNVFVDLTLEGTGLTADVGPVQENLEPVDEPAGLALFAVPLLALIAVRLRARAS